MAMNKLTANSDLATRGFFKAVAADLKYLQDSPAHRRQLLAILLEALNYQQLPNGAFVATDRQVTKKFGTDDYSAYEDEWADDEERAREACYPKDTTETSASVESESAEVRESVLPEDVR